ncbi:BTAD domain-containing putative transcriptional regulator [Streptomyces sp. NPDC003247]|uniref:AfsR/SARP family transcriptional regulator n=1 Tax=Streptomyces sp. NPDC003247 TaxID=3364677 RepID=UPI0036B99E83
MRQEPAAPSFSVLGPVRAWREGAELDLGPPQQRATLAVLLVRVKRPVPVGEIADVLWGQGQPVSATNVIHRHIGMLRRLLEPGLPNRAEGQRLVRVFGGYRLRVGTDDVDLSRFRHLRELAQNADLAGAAEEAVERFVEAVSLWRGPVVAGVPAVARGHRVFTVLEDEYVAAVREAADTALRHGLADRVLPALERCGARHPLDEGVLARLALSLAATGHQAEALDVCHAARTRLAEERGVTPGAELRAAHERVLRGLAHHPANHPANHPVTARAERPGPGRPAPAPRGGHGPARTTPPPPAAATPPRDTAEDRWPAPRPTGGPRHRPPAHDTTPRPARAGGADAGRRLISYGGVPPVAPRGFVGRAAEAARLLAAAVAARPGDETMTLAAVCGQAGVGKTALATEVAHRLTDRFPDGLIHVSLRGFDPSAPPVAPGEAIRGLLEALDVPPARLPEDRDDLDAHTALWRSVLSGRRFLLLLDDARDAEQIRPLLPGAHGCTVLVTSRDQLSGLVAADGAHRVVLDPLTPEGSLELLATRVDADRLAADREGIGRLVECCAGLPFALHLAAGRITDAPGKPASGAAVPGGSASPSLDEADLRTVRRSLYGSYRTLVADAARLFRLLALHPEPEVSTGGAAALAGVEPRPARVLLSALTGVHLLDECGPGRFTLRPLERSYAHALVHATDSAPARAAAVRRLLGHLVRHELPADRPRTPRPYGAGHERAAAAPASPPGTGAFLRV